MHALLLSTRCLLAVVFLVAAVGKLLDLEGSRTALEEFGVPARLARIGGAALPIAELIVAVALVLKPTAVAGGIGALLLLLAFVGGVGYAMSQHRTPDCHCFGQIHSEPAGPATLIRNGVLAVLAILVIAEGPGPSLTGALGSLHGSQIGLVATAVAAAVFAATTAQLWADRRRLQRELTRTLEAKVPPGLPRGSQAPEFELAAVRGDTGSLRELLELGRPVVLIFASTTCGPCLSMLPTLAGWQTSLSGSLSLVAIFSGERGEIEQLSDEHGLSRCLAQEDNETFYTYALRATPSAVRIDADGTVGGAPAEGVPAIEALVRATLASGPSARLAVHHG